MYLIVDFPPRLIESKYGKDTPLEAWEDHNRFISGLIIEARNTIEREKTSIENLMKEFNSIQPMLRTLRGETP
jgi:hypothetical protein